MIDITAGRLYPAVWHEIIVRAAGSSKMPSGHSYICRVIYPDKTCKLELKTEGQVQEHFKRWGRWEATCGKMSLSDVINITRILFLNFPVESEQIEPLKEALNRLATRAEEKYKKGFCGTVRKILSMIFNFFIENTVQLFSMPKTNVALRVIPQADRLQPKLPFYIGSNADFARLVANQITLPQIDIEAPD